MREGVEQRATGEGNIQVGRDIRYTVFQIFQLSAAPAAAGSRARYAYGALVLCLIATTLPHPYLNIAASLATILLWFTWSATSRILARPLLLLLTAGSLLSGCSGAILSDLPPLVCNQDQPCRAAEVKGFAILGMGLEGITPETAMKKANLTKAILIDRTRSYGLISTARVVVYGE